ncbi:MAG: class I SAM-dependent methyltransferase [Methanoregula sp.]|jgi:O-methyltransferase involved in polyketide biosynthesis
MTQTPEESGQAALPLTGVARTSFLTLYCHVNDAQSEDPILNDTRSVEIATVLDTMLTGSDDDLTRILPARRIRPSLVTHIAMRARRYDEYSREFLSRFPDAVVVNIGCGLDSRFVRIDNGIVQYYDLDLPGIMAVRKRFFEEAARYHTITSSVLDFSWMDIVSGYRRPVLFLAEGVFMYLHQDGVRALVLELRKRFPGSELVCEVVNSRWLREPYKRFLNYKMRKQLHFGKDVTYHSGLSSTREMEEWDSGIRFLDDWSYLDSYQKNLGWLKVFRHIGFMRYTQWTVHYRLG